MNQSASSVSVIITCYKEGVLLKRAIESVIPQLNEDTELIIINDASPCEITNRICDEYKYSGQIKVHYQSQNGGLSASRNKGFEIAKYDLCMFLDADDILPPHAVGSVIQGAMKYPDADFYFGDYLQTNVELGTDRIISCQDLVDEDGFLDARKLLQCWKLSGHTACKKTTWTKAGKYHRLFSYGYQDVDFYMRVLACKLKGKYIPGLLYHWFRSEKGMNEARLSRQLYYNAYSYSYYETLGGISNYWEKVINQFLEKRDNLLIRKDAQKLMWRLFPTKWSRAYKYLQYLYFLCLPSYK